MRDAKQIGIMIAGFLLVAGGLGYWWHKMRQEGTKLDKQIATLKKDNSGLRAKANEIPEAEERLLALQAEGEEAKHVLPEGSDPYDMIALIVQKVEESGIAVNDVKNNPVRKQARSSFEMWEFPIQLSGTYDQIATFINKMEAFEQPRADGVVEKRFFSVRSIAIAAAQGGLIESGSPQSRLMENHHKCTLVMQTYRYSGEEEPPAKAKKK